MKTKIILVLIALIAPIFLGASITAAQRKQVAEKQALPVFNDSLRRQNDSLNFELDIKTEYNNYLDSTSAKDIKPPK